MVSSRAAASLCPKRRRSFWRGERQQGSVSPREQPRTSVTCDAEREVVSMCMCVCVCANLLYCVDFASESRMVYG